MHPAPSWLGKLSTVFQMVTVLAAMVTFYFRHPARDAHGSSRGSPPPFTVASGLQYIVQGLKQINPPAATAAASAPRHELRAHAAPPRRCRRGGRAPADAGRDRRARTGRPPRGHQRPAARATRSTFTSRAASRGLACGSSARGASGARCSSAGGADWGLTLEPPQPSEIATCANKCVFCFIHQLPRGMRKSLYVKDDDFRLSFLHGNYITLTDLDEDELERIEAQRLSPLYVSVHATDPELRHRLLGRPRVKRELLPVMERLAPCRHPHARADRAVPGLERRRAPRAVGARAGARCIPRSPATAVVPVGLTRHRERLPELRTVTDDEARALVPYDRGRGRSGSWLRSARASSGPPTSCICRPGAPLPPARTYEGFAIAEDGIGLVRRFTDGWRRAVAPRAGRLARPRDGHGRDRRDVRAAPARAPRRAARGRTSSVRLAPIAERLVRSRHRSGGPPHRPGHRVTARGARPRRRGARSGRRRARRRRRLSRRPDAGRPRDGAAARP